MHMRGCTCHAHAIQVEALQREQAQWAQAVKQVEDGHKEERTEHIRMQAQLEATTARVREFEGAAERQSRPEPLTQCSSPSVRVRCSVHRPARAVLSAPPSACGAQCAARAVASCVRVCDCCWCAGRGATPSARGRG